MNEDEEEEERVRAKIEKYTKMLQNEENIGRALRRLERIPMTLDRLAETSVGRTVNQLRFHDEFGDKAQQLVDKWKDIAREYGIRERRSPSVSCETEDNRWRKDLAEMRSTEMNEALDKHCDKGELKEMKKDEKHRTNNVTESQKKQRKRILTENDLMSGDSFAATLAASDAVKHSKPKKVKKDEVDWSKHSSKLDPNYRPGRLLNYQPQFLATVSTSDQEKKVVTETPLDDNLFKTKKASMKMYAGRKRHFDTTVPSLFDLCMKTICDHVHAIEYTGTIPFFILRPALEKCSATQLFQIEQRNPYLAEESDSLWEKMCKRDFRDLTTTDHETWKQCYQRSCLEREKKLQTLSSKIVQQQKQIKGPMRKAKLADAKAPRDVRRRQLKHGTTNSQCPLPVAQQLSCTRRERAVGNISDIRLTLNDKKSSKPKKGVLMVKALKMLKGQRR